MIENFVSKCTECEKFQRSNVKEPLISQEIPQLPFLKIAIDIGEYGGKCYLISVDCLSKWLDIIPIESKCIEEIILKLKCIFSNHGIPKIIVCDNNPFCSYKFKLFASDCNFDISYISPHYHQSNGLAEKGVGVAKGIIKKAKCLEDIYTALLEYRVTSVAGLDYSPSEILMGRLLRSKIPATFSNLQPKLVYNSAYEKLVNNQASIKHCYDKTSREREPFKKGDDVVVQNPLRKVWERAKIIDVGQTPRNYKVLTETQRTLNRNSMHIRKSLNVPRFTGLPYEEGFSETKATDTENLNKASNNNQFQESLPVVRTRCGRAVKQPAKFRDFVAA
ncbi:uncharacterized protein K02A2.6-like [Photinus pyralis]|uniref:uncharacterized protein K02A2.6-like n=1 Tax=Photinus pyralis TaxID=7054 RepID=UPI0012674AD6|nr:uncharacterized protein K02A2.6-like [Photinus pyralis]XP_031331463.1 uncharacterized protein K02A2.6-like [Photinus pyralis]